MLGGPSEAIKKIFLQNYRKVMRRVHRKEKKSNIFRLIKKIHCDKYYLFVTSGFGCQIKRKKEKYFQMDKCKEQILPHA